MRDMRGQSTVEYVVITAAFVVMVMILGALWRALEEGTLVDHALSSASHHIQLAFPSNGADIFLY